MSVNKWKLLLESPWGCRITGFSMFGICLFGLINNINRDSGGDIESFSELWSYFGEDEIVISVLGLYFLFAFLYAAKNAEKMKRQKWRNHRPKEQVEDPYENAIARYEEKQRMKPNPYTMGRGKYEITFLVPPGYSWVGESELDEKSGYVFSPVMLRETGGMVMCTYNVATEEELIEGDYYTPEELVQDDYELLAKKTQENTKIQQMVVDGRYVVHYYIARYKEGRDKFQEIYAACEVERGKVFEFQLTFASWKYKVTENDMEPFFQFQL